MIRVRCNFKMLEKKMYWDSLVEVLKPDLKNCILLINEKWIFKVLVIIICLLL